MALHMGLGFGINEIYIMSPHYLYVLPIAMAYLLRSEHKMLRLSARILVLLLTVYLWVHNGLLLTQYMLT
jgi:hypothetical protein